MRARSRKLTRSRKRARGKKLLLINNYGVSFARKIIFREDRSDISRYWTLVLRARVWLRQIRNGESGSGAMMTSTAIIKTMRIGCRTQCSVINCSVVIDRVSRCAELTSWSVMRLKVQHNVTIRLLTLAKNSKLHVHRVHVEWLQPKYRETL